MDFTPVERKVFGLQSGDVVLAEASGSATQVGRPALWRDELPGCCYQNTVIRFRPYAVDPDYALIVFQHYLASGRFSEVARGVGILHLGATRFAELSFPLPPLPEQARIAEIVGNRQGEMREAAASLRSALGRIDEQTLEILATAVAGGLVETEAVIASREGRVIEDASTVLTRAADDRRWQQQTSLFDPPGRETEVQAFQRPTPPGWVWVRMDQAGEVSLGMMRAPKRHHGSNMRPYLRVANVFEDRIDLTDVKSMHFEPDEVDAYQLRHGDILLNEGQSPELVGRPAIYRDELPGACFQNTLLRFRGGPSIEPEFALLVFRHYLHTGEFRGVAQWSTRIAHLTRTRFAAMPFPVPPLAEQRRIVAAARARLDDASTQRAAVRASLDRMPNLMAELLCAAVSGTLTAQNTKDEPAAELLARLGPPPRDDLAMSASDEPKNAAIDASLGADGATGLSITGALRSAGKPMRLTELFHAAGYDRNSTEDIERFYVELQGLLGKTVRTANDATENAELEAIDNAPR
jgi:type I restriction enzyme S subunit